MKNIILDLDTGIDDSLALALAVADENINLLAVCTTYGNVTTDNSCLNSRYILDLLKQKDIPILKGLSHAIDKDEFIRNKVSARIHGENGLGNLEVDLSIYKDIDFPFFEEPLLDLIKKFDNDLTIITTGPLTNMAYMIQKHPDEIRKVKEIITMGGALLFKGNVTFDAEANIHQDPVAAKIVFESDIEKAIVPLDVTQKSRISVSDINKWEALNKKESNFFSKMLYYYINENPCENECFVHDPSAVMFAINPSLFTIVRKEITVLCNKENYGRIVGNDNLIQKNNSSSKLCLDVNDKVINQYISKTMLNFFKSL